ncbi:uncharacterized protein METZ01_LOCUS129100, partial [marine metagenome]
MFVLNNNIEIYSINILIGNRQTLTLE